MGPDLPFDDGLTPFPGPWLHGSEWVANSGMKPCGLNQDPRAGWVTEGRGWDHVRVWGRRGAVSAAPVVPAVFDGSVCGIYAAGLVCRDGAFLEGGNV